MKIGFYTDTYLPNIDGVVVQIASLKKQLEKKNHYVHVFAPGTTSEKTANKDSSITYYSAIKFPPYPQYKLALFPFSSVWKANQLGLEVIHSHALATMGLASIAAAKTLRLPLVGTFHTMIPLGTHYVARNLQTQETLAKAAWKAIKTFYKPFDLVTAPSKTTANMLKQHGVENVKIVSNGIETDKFNTKADGEKKRREFGTKKEKLFVFVGRVTREKNVDVLVKAFSKTSGARLVIVGDGPDFPEIKRLVERSNLGKKVLLTGAVPHGEVANIYAAADWQVSASTFETQGLSILEGMACGKPCIGANSLAIPETVKDKHNGFLFQPFDVEELRGKIENAISLPENRYKKMCKNAGETGKSHSIQKTADRWLGIYQSLL